MKMVTHQHVAAPHIEILSVFPVEVVRCAGPPSEMNIFLCGLSQNAHGILTI